MNFSQQKRRHTIFFGKTLSTSSVFEDDYGIPLEKQNQTDTTQSSWRQDQKKTQSPLPLGVLTFSGRA